jgi:sulfatase modifying factor 1
MVLMLMVALLLCGCAETREGLVKGDKTGVDTLKPGQQRVIEDIKLCWCPSGRFRMGSALDEPERRSEEAQVEVTISKGFWMGRYEVTQGEWKKVMGVFPRAMTDEVGDEFPMGWINYAEAQEFCKRLTERGHASGQLGGDWEFRLPTEAQWEYACRAGTTTASAFGVGLDRTEANFQGKCYNTADKGPVRKHAAKVGSYYANAWGLHDMHGNVYEWCRDWYHTKMPGGVDPDLSEVKGDRNRDGTYSRSRRGGGWSDDGAACRSACRLRYEPERSADHIGFRVIAEHR